MKHVFVFAIAMALFAESAGKLEMCGTPKGHECSCLRRTQARQEKLLKQCRDAGGSAPDCLAKVPFHCDIVDQPELREGDDGNWTTEAEMSDYCARNCKRHDCKCDDGPVCHIGHRASDHNTRSSGN
jgi:hypothetical protein